MRKRFKERRVIDSREMECIRCKEVYGKEMFSVRVRICTDCREEARIKILEKKRERARLNRETEEGRTKANESQKKYRESERGQEHSKEYRMKVYICEVCECEVRKNHKARHEKTKKHKDKIMAGEEREGEGGSVK